MRPILLVVSLIAAVAVPATAMFMRLHEPVPVDRLIENVGAYVEDNPDDAEGHYTLGRIHSLAYAKMAFELPQTDGAGGPDEVVVAPVEVINERIPNMDEPAKLPWFEPYDSVQVGKARFEDALTYPRVSALPDEGRRHLEASLAEYAKAVEMAPDEALYWLGYGWMLEELAEQTDAAVTRPAADEITRPADSEELRDRAARAYNHALTLDFQKDDQVDTEKADVPVGVEAADNLLRLIKRDGVSEAEQPHIARIEKQLAEIKARPLGITPIVFAANSRDLADLIDPHARVAFDLAADGLGREWPWVTPDAALLVWDPNGVGSITSGTQLVGGRTWNMFWPDGYAALAALDDDRDGELRGKELQGLAAWFDRDGNGVSTQGEVVSLATLGVAALSTAGESHGREDVAAWQPNGVTFHDGRVLPTWDWLPTSHADAETK